MQVAGIDLAWGSRARTGIALTDHHGALLRSGSVVTDDEIAAFLAGSSPAVIAIDAPLVVTNAAGMRDCERDLSRDFRRFHAGTHPTNMGRPSMQPQPRGMRLAEQHGWRIDSSDDPSTTTPVALEVYPHSSMVGLFSLDRVLEYKARSGRTPEMRRAQFIKLIDLMEQYCDRSLMLSSNARWQEISEIVDGATRQAHLNMVEDEIDAIFCAYLAWVFATTPDALTTYGNVTTGVIVTFPPPA
ncbi:MAG: DUF429 domain-containing protein [Candidatus Nanopelagicales bacterium]